MGAGKMIVWLAVLLGCFGQAVPRVSAEESILEGAKKEGRLSIYESMTVTDINELQKKFTEKYPFIKTEMFRASSRGLYTRFTAEMKANRHAADIIGTAGPETYLLKKSGFLMEYATPEGQFYQKDFKNPYWITLFIFPHVMGYNTRLVAPGEAPKSYQDLLNKKWEGKLAMDREDYEWFSNQQEIMGEGKWLKFMEGLARQKISFFRGKRLIGQLMAAGEFPVAVNVYAHVIEDIKRQGAPVTWVPVEPVLASIHTIAISAHAPHPNCAKLFVDFIASKDGQQVISNLGRVPARMDVKLRYPNLVQGIKFVSVNIELA